METKPKKSPDYGTLGNVCTKEKGENRNAYNKPVGAQGPYR